MVLSFKTGSFTKSTSTSTPVTQTITGVGFQPKAVILFTASASAASSTSPVDGYILALGFSDGTNHRSISTNSVDAVTNTSTSRRSTDVSSLVSLSGSGSSAAYEGTITAFDSDGFTVSWTTNSATDYEINYVCYGGSDITNVKVGSFDFPGSQGNFDVTTVGFQPNIVFMMGIRNATAVIGATHNISTFGAAKSSTEQGVVWQQSLNGQSGSEVKSGYDTTRCIIQTSTIGAANINGEATFSTMLSNGFRINVTDSDSGMKMFYLAIQGGSWKVGTAPAKSGTTGNLAVTGTGFQPKGLFFFGASKLAPSDASTVDARLNMGAAGSSTQQTCITVADADAASPTISVRANHGGNQRCIRGLVHAASASTATTTHAASLVSLDSDGFTLNWVNVEATNQRNSIFVAAGDTQASGGTVNVVRILKYNILTTGPTITRTFRYNNGGRVTPDLILTHRFNILGIISRLLTSRYDLYKQVYYPSTAGSPGFKFRYGIAQSANVVSNTRIFKYNIISQLISLDAIKCRFLYNIEDSDIQQTGWGKPLRPLIIIYPQNNFTTPLITYNSFHPELATNGIKVESVNVRLASESAGDFDILIEDHAKVIDPTIIGEGNAVLINAAKTETALSDGDHHLLFGFVRERSVIREDTGTLQYRLSGHGAAITFNERITNFTYSARRVSAQDSRPDWTDTKMFASSLAAKLVGETDHLPIGFPRINISTYGILNKVPRVDDFIPSIDEPMTEAANVMNRIADTVSAIWGVDVIRNPTAGSPTTAFLLSAYLSYPTTEHSGITIKDSIRLSESDRTDSTGEDDLTNDNSTNTFAAFEGGSGSGGDLADITAEGIDDPATTCYLVGPWSYTDTVSKDDGFTNRFFAKAGVKDSTGNIVNITNIKDKYTALFSNTTPGPDIPGSGGLGGTNVDIVRFPSQATAGFLILPNNNFNLDYNTNPDPTDEEQDQCAVVLANLQRQHPTVKMVFCYTANTDPTTTNADIRLINRFRTLRDGGVTVCINMDGDPAVNNDAALRAKIDKAQSLYDVDGISLMNVMGSGSDETLNRSYYQSIAQYIKNTKGFRFAVFQNYAVPIYVSWITQIPEVDIWRYARPGRLVDAQTWRDGDIAYPSTDSNATPPKKKFVFPYNISEATGYTDEMIRAWIRDVVEAGIASYIGISRQPLATYDAEISPYASLIMDTLEDLQKEQPSQPGEPIPLPNPRDLCQSFKPGTKNVTDIMLVLSKIGNPIYKSGSSSDAGTSSPDVPNAVHGHIESSEITTVTETDPNTGQQIVTVTETPSGEIIGSFSIPFDQISTTPTPIFLSNIIMQRTKLTSDRTYFVVLFGRGQDENNTVRWHLSDGFSAEGFEDTVSGERIPGGHSAVQPWTMFNQSQSPGFAMRFFDTTLQFIEASDSDSIDKFGLVESVVDLSFIPDENLAARYLHAMLTLTSKPKRIYDIGKITAPDKLILPGKLVSIVDRMSSHPSIGSDIVDAEIVEAEYDFSASSDSDPMGCRFISIKPVGYVDFAMALWRRRLAQGLETIPTGEDVVVIPNPGGGGVGGGEGEGPPPPPTPPPPPPNVPPPPPPAPPPPPSTPPPPPPPPPVPAPPDLDTTGILRTRGPYTSIADFWSAVNNAIAGDMIILANGSYSIASQDTTISSRSGTSANPIIVRAENVGGVTLTGSNGIDFSSCHYFTWYGFIHRHSGNMGVSSCNDFRFARNDVSLPTGTARVHWIVFTNAVRAKVDHNYFHDKDTSGGFATVNYSSNQAIGTHAIWEYNYFRNQLYSANDMGEAMMMGSSDQCRTHFRVIFRYNYLTRCNGDGELITNKSSCNLYYNNTWYDSNSVLTLRHGDSTAVIANYFERTGLRVYGADNVIANNHITLNSNSTSNPRGPLTIGIGDTTRPTAQGAHYETVDNNSFCYNTINNDTGSYTPIVRWGSTPGGSIAPSNCLFRGNIIMGRNGSLFDFQNGAGVGSNTFSNNIAWIQDSAAYLDITTGMATRVDPGLTRNATDGVWRISGTGSGAYQAVSTSTNPLSGVAGCTLDIDGETRTGRADAGADQYSTAGVFPAKPKKRITVDDVGTAATVYLGDSPTWDPTS